LKFDINLSRIFPRLREMGRPFIKKSTLGSHEYSFTLLRGKFIPRERLSLYHERSDRFLANELKK